jgi:hypothetical protein
LFFAEWRGIIRFNGHPTLQFSQQQKEHLLKTIHQSLLAMLLMASSLSLRAETLAEAKAAVDAHDFKTAATIYQNLAALGDAKAQYNLGLMYSRGDGVKQNFNEALKWYRLSAEQGFVEAQYNLGLILLRSEWVTPDYEESIKWYTKAAEQGHVKSQVDLGVAYLRGEIVQYDAEAAQKWFIKASEQGNQEAQFDLSSMYLQIEGPEHNMVLGYMWLLISADYASKEPSGKKAKMIRFIESKMSPEQIAEGKQLADACLAKQLKDCPAGTFKKSS